MILIDDITDGSRGIADQRARTESAKEPDHQNRRDIRRDGTRHDENQEQRSRDEINRATTIHF
jgi:hypothetical protein